MLGNKVSGELTAHSLRGFSQQLLDFHVAPALFKEKLKLSNNVWKMNWLCFDFDAGTKTSQSIFNACKSRNWNCVIAASKNHLVDKLDGKGVIERFHVFLPLGISIDNSSNYKIISRHIAQMMDWPLDRVSQEISRYYYKHKSILFVNESDKPIGEKFLNLILKTEEVRMKNIQLNIEKQKLQRIRKNPVIKDIDAESRMTLDRLQSTRFFQTTVEGFNHQGQRYATMKKIVGFMKSVGFSSDETVSIINRYAPPVANRDWTKLTINFYDWCK
jgi:hypothetical protein